MKILIDSAMPYWRELFLPISDVQVFNAGDLDFDGRSIKNDLLLSSLEQTEYLLVRSTTKVNAALLECMPNLKFVGTATAGFDHLNIEALEERNIQWFAASGCNAQAVTQYVVSTLLLLANNDNFNLSDKTVTIIGYGQVGSRVARAIDALGARVQIYDPPLEKLLIQAKQSCRESEFWDSQPLKHDAFKLLQQNSNFITFEQVLKSDIICIHCPLNKSEEFNNYHLFDKVALSNLNKDQYLINAGRGEVIDNQALLSLFEQDDIRVPNVVLDVWENEPFILRQLIPHLRIATPHIAGHTLEGKAMGTYMLYQQVCKNEHIDSTIQFQSLVPESNISVPKELTKALDQKIRGSNTMLVNYMLSELLALCNLAYLVENDDRVFRQHMAQSESIAKLRQQYPIRREFSAINLNAFDKNINELLLKIGFIISNDSRTSHI